MKTITLVIAAVAALFISGCSTVVTVKPCMVTLKEYPHVVINADQIVAVAAQVNSKSTTEGRVLVLLGSEPLEIPSDNAPARRQEIVGQIQACK